MKNIFLSVLFACLTSLVVGQQLTYQSQYMLNPYFVNPGAAGSDPSNPIAISSRQQWAGFNEAPKTHMLGMHAGILENMGVGGLVYNDITGPLNRIGAQLTYAYHINVGEESKLGFGLSGMFTQSTLDASDFILHDEVDATLNGGNLKSFNPDADFGVYYYGSRHYVGISVPQLFQNKYKFGDQMLDQSTQVRHYYLNAGYDIPVGVLFNIEPSTLVRMTESGVFQFDVNTRLKYKQNTWIGVSYRHDESMVALFGIKRDEFTIGYAYDYTLSNIRNYSVGTHELYFQFDLVKPKDNVQINSPRAD